MSEESSIAKALREAQAKKEANQQAAEQKTEKQNHLLREELRKIAQIFARTEKEMQTHEGSSVRVSPFDPETHELKVAIAGSVFTLKIEVFTGKDRPYLSIREGPGNFLNLVPMSAGEGIIRWQCVHSGRIFKDSEALCQAIALEPYDGKLFKR